MIFVISASQVTRITGVNHWHLAFVFETGDLYFAWAGLEIELLLPLPP
jgi:hypothetical protein